MKRLSTYLGLLFMSWSSVAFSQPTDPVNETSDSVRVALLIKQANEKLQEDPAQARELMSRAQSISRNAADWRLEAVTRWEYSVFISEFGQDSLAVMTLDSVATVFQEHGDINQALRVKIAKAKILEKQNRFEEIVQTLTLVYPLMDSLGTVSSRGYVHNFLGLSLWKLGRLAEAETHLKRAMEIFREAQLAGRLANVYNNLGVIYFNWNRYNQALKYYQLSAGVRDSLRQPDRLALLNSNIGATYLKLGDLETARKWLTVSRQMAEDSENERALIYAYHWLSSLEFDQHNYELSAYYARKALKYYRENAQPLGVVQILHELTRIRIADNDLENALLGSENALELSRQVGDRLGEAQSLRWVGYVHLLRNEIEDADRYLNMALKLADQGQFGETSRLAMENLGMLELIRGNPMQGEWLRRRAETYRDSLFNENLQSKIGELQYRIEILDRDHQIRVLNDEAALNALKFERERGQHALMLVGVIGLLILISLLLFIAWRQHRSNTIISLQRRDLQIIAEKLQLSVDEQNRLFRIIGHDLRGPLGTMTQLLEAMLENELTADEVLGLLPGLQRTANSTYRLMENLLNWASLKSGKLEMKLEPTPVNAVFQEILELLQSHIDQKRIQVKCQISDEVAIVVDRHMFATILRNLISNAIKYTPIEGQVMASARPDESGQNVIVQIEDSGIGIPEDALPALFDPGENLRREGTEGEPSSGLGLVLVRDFTTLLGGKLSVASREAVGTSFTLTFPKAIQ